MQDAEGLRLKLVGLSEGGLVPGRNHPAEVSPVPWQLQSPGRSHKDLEWKDLDGTSSCRGWKLSRQQPDCW